MISACSISWVACAASRRQKPKCICRIQSVRPRDRPEIRAAEVDQGRIPPRALEKPDDRRGNGGEVPVAGAPTSASRSDRCLVATTMDARGYAEGWGVDRDDQGVVEIHLRS